VSTVSNFPITTSMTNDQYDIGVNRAFMNSLGQKSIPVLLVEQKRHIQLLSGGNAIMDYLKKSCR
jgi:protein-disulfide isomerase-like protein with CxxC motif